MSDLCLLDALDLVRTRLDQPGVLRGRQRSPAFRDKVLRAAKLIIVRHMRAVRMMARLGEAHRIPFARRAVARLCGVAAWALERVIPILERIGLLSDRSVLARWCEGNHRSITPGAKAYWYRPSLFAIGADYSAILVGNDLAGLPSANQCAPEVSTKVQKVDLDESTAKLLQNIGKFRSETIRRASIPSSPSKLGEINAAVEGALDGWRRQIRGAMPDDRRSIPPSPAESLAALATRARAWSIEPLSADASRIMRGRSSHW